MNCNIVPVLVVRIAGIDICVVHLSTRAVEEDPSVCWEYDGKDDCRFTSTDKTFDAIVDCPECGDDAHLAFPSALPGAPDYGEYECSSCRWSFTYRKLDPNRSVR